MTYRERISKLIKDKSYGSDEYEFALSAYDAYVEKFGPVKAENGKDDNDFFGDGGKFDTFLKQDYDEDVIIEACIKHKIAMRDRQYGDSLIDEGVNLIRKGFRIRDNTTHLAHSDFIADRPRTYTVSLVGIHDEPQTIKN